MKRSFICALAGLSVLSAMVVSCSPDEPVAVTVAPGPQIVLKYSEAISPASVTPDAFVVGVGDSHRLNPESLSVIGVFVSDKPGVTSMSAESKEGKYVMLVLAPGRSEQKQPSVKRWATPGEAPAPKNSMVQADKEKADVPADGKKLVEKKAPTALGEIEEKGAADASAVSVLQVKKLKYASGRKVKIWKQAVLVKTGPQDEI